MGLSGFQGTKKAFGKNNLITTFLVCVYITMRLFN